MSRPLIGLIPCIRQDAAGAGVRPAGAALDVESCAALRGHRFRWTTAGNYLQQKVIADFLRFFFFFFLASHRNVAGTNLRF